MKIIAVKHGVTREQITHMDGVPSAEQLKAIFTENEVKTTSTGATVYIDGEAAFIPWNFVNLDKSAVYLRAFDGQYLVYDGASARIRPAGVKADERRMSVIIIEDNPAPVQELEQSNTSEDILYFGKEQIKRVLDAFFPVNPKAQKLTTEEVQSNTFFRCKLKPVLDYISRHFSNPETVTVIKPEPVSGSKEKLKQNYDIIMQKYLKAQAELEQLESQTKQEPEEPINSWVPVETALPAINTSVFVVAIFEVDGKKRRAVTIASLQSRKKWTINNTAHSSSATITHWMTVPALPK